MPSKSLWSGLAQNQSKRQQCFHLGQDLLLHLVNEGQRRQWLLRWPQFTALLLGLVDLLTSLGINIDHRLYRSAGITLSAVALIVKRNRQKILKLLTVCSRRKLYLFLLEPLFQFIHIGN